MTFLLPSSSIIMQYSFPIFYMPILWSKKKKLSSYKYMNSLLNLFNFKSLSHSFSKYYFFFLKNRVLI